MSNTLNFNSLAEYLRWRNQKRVLYKALSDELRNLKQKIRATMRDSGWAGEMQTSLLGLKGEATEIMEERRTAKQMARDAWEQWRSERREQAA